MRAGARRARGRVLILQLLSGPRARARARRKIRDTPKVRAARIEDALAHLRERE